MWPIAFLVPAPFINAGGDSFSHVKCLSACGQQPKSAGPGLECQS